MSDESMKEDRELALKIEHFAERLNLVFSYFFSTLEFWNLKEFQGEPSKNDRTWMLQTIQNACLNTTLIALRDLDDFLTPRMHKTRPDDIRASDFGMANDLSFLTVSEREAINKNIAHTTLRGAHAQDLRWDVFELTTKAIGQGIAFLDWVVEHHAHHFLVWTAAMTCKGKTQAIYKSLAKEIKARKRA
ncbi:MAG: hypothetical protein U1F98_13220 [Verrucomicrobiota bacterium]